MPRNGHMPGDKIALLDCFHTIALDPAPTEGDTVYCKTCKDYREVTYASVEWKIRCEGCTLSRSYGADEARARQVAERHAVKMAHDVRIIRGGHQVDLARPASPPLPFGARFQRAHPDHQASLRRGCGHGSNSRCDCYGEVL